MSGKCSCLHGPAHTAVVAGCDRGTRAHRTARNRRSLESAAKEGDLRLFKRSKKLNPSVSFDDQEDTKHVLNARGKKQ